MKQIKRTSCWEVSKRDEIMRDLGGIDADRKGKIGADKLQTVENDVPSGSFFFL